MDAMTFPMPTFTPLHPWWCADVDDDPHTEEPHHSGFEGVVGESHSFIVGIGLRQHSGGPVCLHLSVANAQEGHQAEAEQFLTLPQSVWLWRTLGIAILLLDDELWVSNDLAGDPYISSRTFPTPTAAFGPMTRPPIAIAALATVRDSSHPHVEMTMADGAGSASRVALTVRQATDVWRHLTSLLKRLGVLPCTV